MSLKDTLESLGLVAVTFLAPIEGVLATVFGLVALDLVTGVLASKKQGIPITSYGLKRTVMKLAVYELVIVLAFVTSRYLTGPSIPVLHLCSSLIGLTELKSCVENLNTISGGSVLGSLVGALQRVSSNSPEDSPPSRPFDPPRT